MSRYLTNKYKNLPLFDDFNFYYNLTNKEIKREINSEKRTENSLIVDEKITDKETSRITNIEYKYILDRKVKTYLFFVIKAFIISCFAFALFSNLLYDFATVVKLNRGITITTFVIAAPIMLSILYAKILILSMVYLNKKPNFKFIEFFPNIQYIGYFFMILNFIVFYLIIDEKTTYLYTCSITLGTVSIYSYVFYMYVLLPLQMIIDKRLNFYRSENEPKYILVEIKD